MRILALVFRAFPEIAGLCRVVFALIDRDKDVINELIALVGPCPPRQMFEIPSRMSMNHVTQS